MPQPDAGRVAETREWLSRAALDLRAADFQFTADPPLTADIVFHCQQLAEKSLKAFLVWNDVPFRKTHNIVEIGEQCVSLDPSLEGPVRRVAYLTEYAWKFRYPGETDEPPESEAREALDLAHALHDAVLSRLPRDAHP